MDLLKAQTKVETRELEMRKVWSKLDNVVTSLHIGHQEGRQEDTGEAGIDGHGSEGRRDSLLGGRRDLSQRLMAVER